MTIIKRSALLLLLVFLQGEGLVAQQVTLDKTRSLFKLAATDEKYCNSLADSLLHIDKTRFPVLYGYKGAVTMMKANYVFSPLKKLSNFKAGRVMLEDAILQDSQNVELRMLRYAIQTNVPGFLNYSSQLSGDRAFLNAALPALSDTYLKKTINELLKL